MKFLRAIISCFLAVAIAALTLFVPAYAAIDPGLIIEGAAVVPDFGDWLLDKISSGSNFYKGFIFDSICSGAGSSLNNRHIFEPQFTTINGKLGNYYICKNCGKSAGEVFEPAYQEHVSELPAQGYTSAGKLIWHPGFTDLRQISASKPGTSYGLSDRFVLSSSGDSFLFTCNSSEEPISFYTGSYYKGKTERFNVSFDLIVPFDGTYSLAPTLGVSYSVVIDGEVSSGKSMYERGAFVHRSAGDSFSSFCVGLSYICGSTSYFSIQAFFPTFEVVPDFNVGVVDEHYISDTRPTVITGDYGIVDNQGIATVIKDCTIVNETTNNYYNPATGQNYPIKDWSYDYPSREYTITTDSNNTVTITYGDENVTIQEGDTIYNIYYVVDGIGEEKPPCAHDWQKGNRTDPTCAQPGLQVYTCSKCGERKSETIPTTAHDWQAETKTDPTCTQPGRQPYACSKCGESKSDTIPALGHDWQVKQSVNTQYDDTGQLVQEGYTIYECTRCGEQNRTTSGAGPPPSGGGDAPGGEEDASIWDKLGDLLGTLITGISGLLGSVLGKLLEALTSLSQLILGGLGTVVETVLSLFDSVPRLFGGFLAFLSAVFPFLPEEMVTLLTFGLAAVVFIGILKAVRK